jgi:hypothetical protein
MSGESKNGVLQIQFTQTLPLFTLEDAQAALQSQENLIDSWIQDLHSPSSLELVELHKNIISIKLLIVKIIGDNASLTEAVKFARCLQPTCDQLQCSQ